MSMRCRPSIFCALASVILLLSGRLAPAAPDVPKEIAVPEGQKLLFKLEARGVQIYKSTQGKSGSIFWILDGPLADLTDEKGARAGFHYDGPSWEASDGSKLIRDKFEQVKSSPPPKPDDDIPWLLVKVKADEGKVGKLSSTTFIQRLETKGGKAPAEIPKRIGTKIGVPYTAVYYFYGKAD